MERKPMGRIMIAVAMVMTALMAGCGGAGSTLERAEAVIDSMPDSALALLSTLDVARLDGGDKAWYALLQSKALDKSYIDVSDDSLIVQAVRYYDGEGSDHEMQAHYYRGVVMNNSGDFRTAVVEFLKAEHLAEALNSDLYYAKSNEMLADVYYKSYNMERSIIHRRIAVESYRNAGKKTNELFAIVEIATSYDYMDLPHRSIELLDSIADQVLDEDSVFIGVYHSAYILPCINLGNNEESLKHAQLVQQYWHDSDYSSDELLLVFQAYYANDMVDEAMPLFYKAASFTEGVNDENIAYLRYKIKEYYNEIDSAYTYIKQMLSIHRERVQKSLSQAAALADRDYNEKLYIDELEAHNKDRLIFALIVIALVMLVMCIILLYRQKAARHRMQLESLIYEFKHQQTQLKDDVYTLFKERFLAIDKIGTEYFTGKDSDKMRSIMLKNIETELMSIVSPQSMSQLRNMINLLLDGVIDRMEAQLTFVKEQDIDFICLLAAGFSMKSIALLMNMTQSNCYSKRRRLKEKISQSGAADAEEFLRILG